MKLERIETPGIAHYAYRGSGMAERPYSTIGEEKRYNDVFTLSQKEFASKKGGERMSRGCTQFTWRDDSLADARARHGVAAGDELGLEALRTSGSTWCRISFHTLAG